MAKRLPAATEPYCDCHQAAKDPATGPIGENPRYQRMYGIVSGFTAAARIIIAAAAAWIIVVLFCIHTNTQNIKESTREPRTPSGAIPSLCSGT
jgi:hypothetical protein